VITTIIIESMVAISGEDDIIKGIIAAQSPPIKRVA